jgi:uncharacterized protein (TIGR02246 family)
MDELRTQWQDAFNKGDVPGFVALYSEEAKLMPSYTKMITGKAGIKGYYERVEPGGQTINIKSIETDSDGSLVYEIGSYVVTWTDLKPDTGKYVSVAKKQDDGSWKIIAHIWNSDLPLPTAE